MGAASIIQKHTAGGKRAAQHLSVLSCPAVPAPCVSNPFLCSAACPRSSTRAYKLKLPVGRWCQSPLWHPPVSKLAVMATQAEKCDLVLLLGSSPLRPAERCGGAQSLGAEF